MRVASTAPVINNWLSTTPSAGIISEGSSLDIIVTFNTEILSTGSYYAAIKISSNDPLNHIITVPIHLRVNPDTGIDDLVTDQIPKQYALYHNYPNPFNPTTTIEYDMPKSEYVRLAIYDILGRHIRTLMDTRHQAGHFQTTWDGTDERNMPVAAGVYFCRMEAKDFVKVIKLALVR